MCMAKNLWRPVMVFLACSTAVGLAAAADPPVATDGGKLLAQFKAAGRNASLTVYPAGLIGRPARNVGEVVALMLERGGMKNLEIDAPEFQPAAGATIDETAKAFGEFVKANPPKTDYALFADFLGSHEKGLDEARAVVVTRDGALVWQDRQTRADADYRKIAPKEPMDCCVLVVQRLRPLLGLDDPMRASAPEGKLAQRWAQKSGVPDKAEFEAMRERQQVLCKAAATATLRVYPALAGDELSAESATHLVELINDAKLAKAAVAAAGPQPEIKGSSNEQKMLWEMARQARDYVQAHRPEADYVLFAHYLMGKDRTGQPVVGGVHFVVCDREGRWVIVDFQNSHHEDFNSIPTKTRVDCDQLVAKRLASYCK